MTLDRTIQSLKERGARVAVAESCSGGTLAATFTAVAGASDYFVGGVVAYANEVKVNVLGVSSETLEEHGAVSRQVAEQMAAGVKRLTGADFAISTTGVAGPGGGSVEKPVGTVWIGVATPGNATRECDGGDVVARCFHFTGTRDKNMADTVSAAIEMLHSALKAPKAAETSPTTERLARE